MNPHEPHRDLLPLYLTGDLEPKVRDGLEAHLDGCSECSDELASLQAALNGLRQVIETEDPEVDLDGFYPDRVRPALARQQRVVTVLRVAALVLAFLGGMILQSVLTRAAPEQQTPNRVEQTARAAEPVPDLLQAYQSAEGDRTDLSRALVALAALSED